MNQLSYHISDIPFGMILFCDRLVTCGCLRFIDHEIIGPYKIS